MTRSRRRSASVVGVTVSISSAPGSSSASLAEIEVDLDFDLFDARRVVFVVVVIPVGAHALDLDPDVERLDGLAVACPHQLEIAHEPTDRRGGQPLCPRLVPDLVVERRDVGHEVRLAGRVHRVDREPSGRRGQQVVAAVGVAPRFADLDQRTDPGQRERPVRPDLPSVADQDDTERRTGVEAVARQRPVALLEDVEGQHDAGTEDGVQREERDLHRPSLRGPI